MIMRVRDFREMFENHRDEEIVHIHIVDENGNISQYGEKADVQQLSGYQLLLNVYV